MRCLASLLVLALASGCAHRSERLHVNGLALTDEGAVYAASSSSGAGFSSYGLRLHALSNKGRHRWELQRDDTFYRSPTDIALAPNGDIVVVDASAPASQGPYRAGLTRYTSAGERVWARSWASGGQSPGDRIALSATGDIYYGGATRSEPRQTDGVVIRMDGWGRELSRHSWAGPEESMVWDLSVDGQGRVHLLHTSNTREDPLTYRLEVRSEDLETMQDQHSWTSNVYGDAHQFVATPSGHAYLVVKLHEGEEVAQTVVRRQPDGQVQWTLDLGIHDNYPDCTVALLPPEDLAISCELPLGESPGATVYRVSAAGEELWRVRQPSFDVTGIDASKSHIAVGGTEFERFAAAVRLLRAADGSMIWQSWL